MKPDDEKIRKISAALANRSIDGEWPLMVFNDAKTPGMFKTKSIKPISFGRFDVKFRCNSLWFSTEYEEILVWDADSKKAKREEKMFDLFECIEVYPIIAVQSNKILAALTEAKVLFMSHRNFISGVLSGRNSLEILKHFSISSREMLSFIRQSREAIGNAVPRGLKQYKLQKIDPIFMQ